MALRDSAEWASATWRTLVHPSGERALGLMQSDSPAEPDGNAFCVVDLSHAPSS